MLRNNIRLLRNVTNTGFGDNPDRENWEVYDEQGYPNVKKTGMSKKDMFSLYHFLVTISWPKFFSLTLLYYVLINLLFAGIYTLINPQGLGMESEPNIPLFWNFFFFSTHTLTTVGYGTVHPVGLWMNLVASFEMYWGLLNFAIMAGLVYGKFSIPKAFVKFSEKLLVDLGKKDEVDSVMFRLIPYKKNAIFSDASIYMLLMTRQMVDGKERYRFYPMDSEIPSIKSLALNWTVVHRVDGDSPLVNFKKEQMQEDIYQIIVYFSAYDEFYANFVKKRVIYRAEDVEFDKTFAPMYRMDKDGSTLLELNKLNETIDLK